MSGLMIARIRAANDRSCPCSIISVNIVENQVQFRQGDPAAALFFFQKSVDTLHSIYVASSGGPAEWPRQPSNRDLDIVDAYLQALGQVRGLRPGAPVKDSVVEVTHRLRTISSTFKRYGIDATAYLERLGVLGQLAPNVDVSGVFWS